MSVSNFKILILIFKAPVRISEVQLRWERISFPSPSKPHPIKNLDLEIQIAAHLQRIPLFWDTSFSVEDEPDELNEDSESLKVSTLKVRKHE